MEIQGKEWKRLKTMIISSYLHIRNMNKNLKRKKQTKTYSFVHVDDYYPELIPDGIIKSLSKVIKFSKKTDELYLDYKA